MRMEPSDEIAAAFAMSDATLLAAVITAGVAAALFVVGEVLKLWRERRDRHTGAVVELLAAWEDVARISSPRIDYRFKLRRRYHERVDISVQTARLLGILPRRDDEVITLQSRLNDRLVRAQDDPGRVAVAAQATVALTSWIASRRRGRRYARWRLTEMGVTENKNGRRVRKAREPKWYV